MNNRAFALIGAGGFVAPRHYKAIKENNGVLLAAIDKNDSVGILDSFFPETAFFPEFERFDRHIEMLKRKGQSIDYISVCSPNYLHDAHIRFGLRYGADVICEKPLVLNPWNLDGLIDLEKEQGHKIYTILQLRLHPAIIALKHKIENGGSNRIYDVELTYITARGNWYYSSWKGDEEKSGGIATNIGIHFFDMLQWIFGDVKSNVVHIQSHDRAAGYLELSKARIKWFLSINSETLPSECQEQNKSTYRNILLDGEAIEFSDGFTDLHTASYKHIMCGNGYGLSEAKPSIILAHQIRTSTPLGLKGDYHPFANLPQTIHPFKKRAK